MEPLGIINKYYFPDSLAHEILLEHGRMVAEKSLHIARRIGLPESALSFIEEAAMLHDIGIFMAEEPVIGCFGDKEYICHGYLGREILEKEGLPVHALVCERHVGVGLSIDDITRHDLPLPRRDMLPVTIEEKIVCYADKFFSKKISAIDVEKPLESVRKSIARYGEDKLERFEEMHRMFST